MYANISQNENLKRHLKKRCARGKIKIVCLGGKFKHILNSSEKVFYGGDTNFSYTICHRTEAPPMETGKHIHHKMCEHGGEHMMTVWILDDKSNKESLSFSVGGYKPETNTVYQFHGCHWHGHPCLKNCTRRQHKKYRDTYQIDRLIKNNG